MAGETYDLIVVGSGLTGASAAYACAVRGYRVLVLERRGTAGRPEEVDLAAVGFEDLVPSGSQALRPVEKLALVTGGRRDEREWAGLLVRRGTLRREYLAGAEAEGGELWLGCRRIDLRTEGEVVVSGSGGERVVSGRFILGADGAVSAVGRAAGVRHRRFLATAWVRASLKGRLTAPEIHLGPAYPGGWAWLFPWEKEVWAGVAMEGRPGETLAFFLAATGGLLRRGGDCAVRTGILPGAEGLPAAAGRILLAGDAAAGGPGRRTDFGVASGRLAGGMVAAALAEGMDVARLAQGYAARLERLADPAAIWQK